MNNNENPVKIGKLRLDGDALYFRSGLKNVTLPYGELERAFMRVRKARVSVQPRGIQSL